jgi:hypothetical protein
MSKNHQAESKNHKAEIKSHKADSFDGGRAASIVPEAERPASLTEVSLSGVVRQRAKSEDDDARALALAIMALTTDND